MASLYSHMHAQKYIATEGEDWDTSTGFVRRVFRECVRQGRKAGGQPGADLWEAYRLLGTGLHTMEDLLAHSNWCEIALRKVGYRDVFCHVGESGTIFMEHITSLASDSVIVIVDSPGGPVPPLVTGTFGGMFPRTTFYADRQLTLHLGADFIHSLMGEATEYV